MDVPSSHARESGPVLALVADLIFASRIRGAAEAAGVDAVTVGAGEELWERAGRERPRLIVLDLEVRGTDVDELIVRLKEDTATASVPVIGFVSHVRTDRIEAARAAGADRVLARSAFVRELPRLLTGEEPAGP